MNRKAHVHQASLPMAAHIIGNADERWFLWHTSKVTESVSRSSSLRSSTPPRFFNLHETWLYNDWITRVSQTSSNAEHPRISDVQGNRLTTGSDNAWLRSPNWSSPRITNERLAQRYHLNSS